MGHARCYAAALILLVAGMSSPPGLRAQDARTDSLEARIRELEARLDSLLAVLGAARDTATRARTAERELEALRAAARAAAGEAPADTAQAAQSRTTNLNILNPEISVTGDILGNFTAPSEGEDNFSAVPREFEFSFQAAIDPYTRTKIFVTHEQDFEIAGFPEEEEEEEHAPVEIEEGYLYWIGLPATLGLKVGRFRQEIGLYNRWHTHALFEIDRPLPSVVFLGEDGLIQTGAALTLPTFTAGKSTQVATLELMRGSNEALFADGAEISFLGNLRSFWDLSASTYFELGATGLYGENGDFGTDGEGTLRSRLLALHAAFRWRPPERALYRDLSLKGEWYFVDREETGIEQSGDGGYIQANYRLNRSWLAGLRADFLNPFDGDPALGEPAPDVLQLAPSITWWQSEWVRLRLQYNYLRQEGGDSNHTVLIQTVWAVGPHKHETY